MREIVSMWKFTTLKNVWKKENEMTREQAKAKLITFGIEEPTDAQVSDFLNSVNGEVKKEKDKAEQYRTDAEKAIELQKQLDEINEKGLTDLEKASKDKEDALAQIANLQKEVAKSKIASIFAEGGISEEDYTAFIDNFSGGDLEQATLSAKAFVSTLSKQKESAIQNYKQEALKGTGKPDGSAGGTDTKSDAEKLAEKIAGVEDEAKTSQSIIDNYKL